MDVKKNSIEWISKVSRLILAGVFIYAAVPKMLSPHDFSIIISGYGVLPDFLVFPVAVFLPLFELFTAVGLILNSRWAIFSTFLLYGVFIVILSYGIYLGLDIDCGCFGPEDPEHDALMGLKTALFRDIVLLLPTLFLVWHVMNRTPHYIKGDERC